MQYSVFRCWLSEQQVQRLRWELTELLAAEDDVLMIPLCANCVAGLEITHSATRRPKWPDAPPSHRIL